MSIAKSEIKKVQETVGMNIRKHRLSNGLSQSKLSAICDIEKTAISRIERGKVNVTLKTLLIFSKALRIPITDLVNLDSKLVLPTR